MYFQHYHHRTKALLNDWVRDRTELMNRAKNIFAEMYAAQQERLAKKESREKQRQLCQALYAKVSLYGIIKLSILW